METKTSVLRGWKRKLFAFSNNQERKYETFLTLNNINQDSRYIRNIIIVNITYFPCIGAPNINSKTYHHRNKYIMQFTI